MSESRFVRGIDANGQEVECSTEYIDYALLKVALVAIDDPLDSEQARLILQRAEPVVVV